MLRKAVPVLMVILAFALTAQAATPPADSIIKGVLADLDRYEKEAEGLTPDRKVNIIRLTKKLPLTESRLNSSRNKSHPSWHEASDRLTALKNKLAALQAGQKPAAAAAVPASGGLTDKQIAAQYNAEYRKLGDELNQTTVAQLGDPQVAAGFRDRLAGLKKLVDSIQSANNRASFSAHYQKLEDYYNKKLARAQSQAAKTDQAAAPKADRPQQTSPAAKPSPTAKPAAGPLDYQNKRALGFFQKDYDRYAKQFENVTPANLPTLKGYLDRLENRLSKLTAKDHPDVIAAHDQVAALKAKLDSGQQGQPSAAAAQSDGKTHKEFQRLYQRNRVALDFLDPAELAKPSEAKRWQKILAEFDALATKFQDRNNPEVKKDLATYAEVKAKIEGGLGASAKVDIRNYPNIDQDRDYLKSLYDKYSANKIFSKGNEALAKRLMDGYDQDKKSFDQLNRQYADFITGNRAASSPSYKQAGDLQRSFRNAGQWMDKFAKARQDYIAGAGPRIDQLLGKAKQMVDQAVREKRAAWFTGGGIQQTMTQAGGQIESLAAIKGENDAQVKNLRSRYSQLEAEVKQAETKLKDSILADAKMPADAYTGSDKQRIVDLAVKEWYKKHPDKKLLAQGVSMPAWERRTEWRWQSDGTRYKVDRSYLQVWVITQTSDAIATQYIVELSKNHLKGDAVTLNAPGNLQGNVFKTPMLLKNVKP